MRVRFALAYLKTLIRRAIALMWDGAAKDKELTTLASVSSRVPWANKIYIPSSAIFSPLGLATLR